MGGGLCRNRGVANKKRSYWTWAGSAKTSTPRRARRTAGLRTSQSLCAKAVVFVTALFYLLSAKAGRGVRRGWILGTRC